MCALFCTPFSQIDPQLISFELHFIFVHTVNKMPNKKKHNQIKSARSCNVDDASMDPTWVDGKEDMEEANVGHQVKGVNILAAIHSLRVNVFTQLLEVVSSNLEIKEAIGAFSERLKLAKSRIGKILN